MIQPKPGFASWAFVPSWIIIGAVAVLLPFFGYITYHNINRQDENAHRMLTEKGAALIRSFEAGTRTGMGMMGLGIKFNLIHLLRETAQQPDIKYLFLADADGRILVHSDPEKMGTLYAGDLDLAAVSRGNTLHSRETTAADGEKVFEVFRRFTLNPFHGHMGPQHHKPRYRLGDILERRGPGSGPGMGRGPRQGMGQGMGQGQGMGRGGPRQGQGQSVGQGQGMGRGPRQGQGQSVGQDPPSPIAPVIVVGLDMSAIQEAGKTDARHFLIMGGVFLLLGFSGIILLFMAYNYQAAKTSLSRIKAFSDNVVQHMPIGLLATDAQGRVVSINQYGAALLHVKPLELLHKPASDCLPPELAGEMEPSEGLAGPGPVGPAEKEIVCRVTPDQDISLELTGARLYDESAGFLGHILLFKDLTEVRALQREISRTQRLATVGRLAAGVAHEIRNPLSSIKGFATYFKERYKDAPKDLEIADIMIREVDRLNKVVGQLLEFARPVTISRQPVRMADLIGKTLKLVQEQADRKNIRIHYQVDPKVEILPVDEDRMRQILLNLYLNAFEAMETGGEMKVEIYREPADGVAVIAVTDTGCGISQEYLPQIFDPYFTTKSSGTGLGLAIVHNIAEAHGCEIRTSSRPGKGTRFEILIKNERPLAAKAVEAIAGG